MTNHQNRQGRAVYDSDSLRRQNMLQDGHVSTPAASHVEVSRRAYELYEQSGRVEGRCQEHWLRAEQEMQYEGISAEGNLQRLGDEAMENEPGEPSTLRNRSGMEPIETTRPTIQLNENLRVSKQGILVRS